MSKLTKLIKKITGEDAVDILGSDAENEAEELNEDNVSKSTTLQEKQFNLGIGSILVCSWGATMILIDFYKVVKETSKIVFVKAIGSKETGDDGFLTGDAVPDENILVKEEHLRIYKKRSREGKDWVLISRKQGFKKFFYKWDGTPQHYDHCD